MSLGIYSPTTDLAIADFGKKHFLGKDQAVLWSIHIVTCFQAKISEHIIGFADSVIRGRAYRNHKAEDFPC